MGLKKILKKVGKPIAATIGGGLGAVVPGLLKGPKSPNMDYGDPAAFDQAGAYEQQQRQALADKQRQQILDFGNEYQANAANYRSQLADSLAKTGQQTFQQANPFILEDLNSRGLASSPSEVSNQQSQALKSIALQNQGALNQFDTDTYNDLGNIRQSALGQYLGGTQDALDSALEMRRNGLQQRFNAADQQNQYNMAKYMGKRQSRDQLLGSLIGLGGKLAMKGG